MLVELPNVFPRPLSLFLSEGQHLFYFITFNIIIHISVRVRNSNYFHFSRQTNRFFSSPSWLLIIITSRDQCFSKLHVNLMEVAYCISPCWPSVSRIQKRKQFLNHLENLSLSLMSKTTNQINGKSWAWHKSSKLIFLFDSCLQTVINSEHNCCIVFALSFAVFFRKFIAFQK